MEYELFSLLDITSLLLSFGKSFFFIHFVFFSVQTKIFFSVLYQVVFLRNYILIVPVLEGRRWSFRRYEEGALFCQERSEENISG